MTYVTTDETDRQYSTQNKGPIWGIFDDIMVYLANLVSGYYKCSSKSF